MTAPTAPILEPRDEAGFADALASRAACAVRSSTPS